VWLQDLDLVKLTAQFVARNGKGFLTDLAMKEARNMEFNFLKPTHSMFTFFTALCDAYSKVRGTYNTSLQQHFSVFIFTKSSKDGQVASFHYSLIRRLLPGAHAARGHVRQAARGHAEQVRDCSRCCRGGQKPELAIRLPAFMQRG